MQKHNVAARLGGAHMHVDGAVVGGWKLGQLEVVGGKQRVRLGFVMQLGGNRTGQRQAVKGAGATANFVHQHQRAGCGGMQNLCSLQHLQHEGGLCIGQVIGGANAGVDRINRSQAATGGGHITAHAGQQRDHGNLPHVGGFAAHVGAGDDLHALLGPQMGVVGYERARAGFCQPRLHHRVAASHDVQAGRLRKLRRRPVQGEAALGQCAQRVQRGQRTGQARQRGHMGLQGVEYLVIEPFFSRQGTLLGAQGLVFKGF